MTNRTKPIWQHQIKKDPIFRAASHSLLPFFFILHIRALLAICYKCHNPVLDCDWLFREQRSLSFRVFFSFIFYFLFFQTCQRRATGDGRCFFCFSLWASKHICTHTQPHSRVVAICHFAVMDSRELLLAPSSQISVNGTHQWYDEFDSLIAYQRISHLLWYKPYLDFSISPAHNN